MLAVEAGRPAQNPMTQLILFDVFNGLIIGAFYALMALGLSLILNLSGVINFAHGGFLAFGAYLAYSLTPYFGLLGSAGRRSSPDRAARTSCRASFLSAGFTDAIRFTACC